MICGDSKHFLFAALLIGSCCSVASQTPSVWDGLACPAGETQKVLIDLSTGEWKFFDESASDQVEGTHGKGRMLGQHFEGLNAVHLPADPLQFETIGTHGDQFGRFLSTNGNNSLATPGSAIGNVNETTIVLALARPCGCIDDDGSRFALCPESSDFCSIDSAESLATCYSVGWIDSIVRNLWPLLWLWYISIFVAVCCTFQGRIILDYFKGTILYYFCGFGDYSENGEARNVNWYNHSIVDEILQEERQDRQDVRRRRNNGSAASRQMEAAVNRNETNDNDPEDREVPPTIVTSPSFLAGGTMDDSDSDGEGEDERGSRFRPITWLSQRLGNVVWPWQTSWKRYIKYNLLLRVEWMTIQDEVAFIESRQERGLPHARYEMKARRWNAATDVCSCSIEPSSLVNSVDEPHCTICFCELEDGDRVGDLGCPHVFHVDCLKMWVTKRNSCPLCNIPIARRKRISSEELVKENVQNQANAMVDLEASGSTTRNNNPVFGSPSIQQRNGPGRLSHMPITPSTVTPSNYSEDEMDDLEAVDLSRTAESPLSAMNEINDDSPAVDEENIGRDSSEDDEIPSPPRRLRWRVDETGGVIESGRGLPILESANIFATPETAPQTPHDHVNYEEEEEVASDTTVEEQEE